MHRALTASSRVLQVLQCVIGVAMIVSSLALGGGPLALGVVLGVLLTALGVGRLWLSGAGRRAGERL